MKIIKAFNLVLGGIVVGTVAAAGLLYLSSKGDFPGWPKAYVIQSGSMEPAIKTGGIVVVRPEMFYSPRDIITFKDKEGSKNVTTHRIIFAQFPEVYFGDPVYLTKGDANKSMDSGQVEYSRVIGRVILTVPYVGYFINYLHTPPGFILFVIVPATIIIYEELKSVRREFRKYLSKFIKRSGSGFSNSVSGPAARYLFIIPVILASVMVVGFSKSFFLDNEESVSNVFGAAAEFPSPTPTAGPSPTPTPTPVPAASMVINEIFVNGGNTGSNWKGQYIELLNTSSSSVDINGWTINDESGSNTISTSSAIPAGGYVVLVGYLYNGPTVPSSATKIVLGEQKFGSAGLDGPGDFVSLKNGVADIDRMSYGDNTSIFTGINAPTSSQSLYRHPSGTDTDTAGDWQTGNTSIGVSNP